VYRIPLLQCRTKYHNRYGVKSRIIFLNKLDRPGASFRSSLQSLLKNRLHPNPVTLTLPIASFDPKDYANGEPGIQGLVDLIRWNVWKWDDDGVVSCHPLPRNEKELEKMDIFPSSHPILPHLVPARAQLLENLSMASEEFMEYLLGMEGSSSYLQVDDEFVMRHLRSVALSNLVLPVVGGSAMKHIGTELLMDFVGNLFPSPLDMEQDAQRQNSPLRLLVWKVNWDERKGWMTFVRVYSGNYFAFTWVSYISDYYPRKAHPTNITIECQSQSEGTGVKITVVVRFRVRRG